MSYMEFGGGNSYLGASKYVLGWRFPTALSGARSKYPTTKMEQQLNRAFSILTFLINLSDITHLNRQIPEKYVTCFSQKTNFTLYK